MHRLGKSKSARQDGCVTLTSPPVRPRHAASLLVWREGTAGLQVLMGVRGAGARFVPNRLVFPGGAVDPGDARAQAASEPQPRVLAALGAPARRHLARAVVHAAARELQEETGLSLGTPPELAEIDYLCRAVTPRAQPIRYDARFLLAPAEAVAGVPQDSEELHSVAFRSVEEAIALDLMLVTREVLLRFRDWHALPAPARAARDVAPVFRERSWVKPR